VGHEPETNFAIAVAGEAVGGIGFILQPDVARRSAEIGYWRDSSRICKPRSVSRICSCVRVEPRFGARTRKGGLRV
jgi:hypothetical protein